MVIDGMQRYRRYPDGKTELDEVPSPLLKSWVRPSDEWSDLPNLVGTDIRLEIHQAADAVLNSRRMKVFQYYASVEDNLCPFAPHEDFGLFSIAKIVAVACYGEVWTDEDTNIIRMSEHLDLSDKLKAYHGWEDFQVVLTYGWLERVDETRRLVPLTVLAQGRHKKQVSWCRGNFTDYRTFTAQSRLIINEAELTKIILRNAKLNSKRKAKDPVPK
jgi:hypothetical protein